MSEHNNYIYFNKALFGLNKKSNVEKVRYNLFSIYAVIIQSTTLFPKNKDIMLFTDTLPLERQIKEYLIRARPQVVARLISEINKAPDERIYILLEKAQMLIDSEKDYKINKKSKNTKNNYIDILLDKYSRGSDNEL